MSLHTHLARFHPSLPVCRPYSADPNHHTDKQLAAARKEKEEGPAALTPREAAVLATKWRDARTALPGETTN